MSSLTPYFNLVKPAKTDSAAIEQLDSNMDTIDTEMHKPPLTVNDIDPDGNRNIQIDEVPLAGNLSTDIAQLITGDFIVRPSGGDAAISNGSASIVSIKGNMVKTGYVPESISMTVTSSTITATLDRDTFVSYVTSSGTITLTYTDEWSADPANYGITVSGSPGINDTIVIEYVKENRGIITPADPSSFTSTGWNLYNDDTGYARVVKYSDEYGYLLGGAYTLVDFAETLTGARSSVSVVNGYFSVPSDGYVFITGGNETTYVLATWSDWIDGYPGDFETYTADTISISEAMLNFPYGLLAVGNVRDEINLNTQKAINRVQRMTFTPENLEMVIESGVAYDTDTNFIYAELETPTTTNISIDGTYTVSDHGIEYFTGTSVPVVMESLYGENLKDKLRRDVVTISQQTLTNAQKAQVLQNIGAASKDSVDKFTSSEWQLFSNLVQTTQTSVSVVTGRSLADFALLIIVVYDDGFVRTSCIVPTTLFKTRVVNLSWVNSVNVQKWVEVTYVSDTSVKYQKSSNASEDIRCIVYGIGSNTYPA